MPKLSTRITSLNAGGSDGWEVFYRARAMIAAGKPVTELTIGEHDIRTAPQILDAMFEAAVDGHTGYSLASGIPALREELARRVTDRSGLATDPANILITQGGQAALFATHMAALDPGAAALYVDPYYATYPGSIRAASGVPVPVRTRAENAFLPEPDEIRRLATRTGARSLLINSPNNPTGVIYPRQTLERIAQVCVDLDLWLISDEVYDTQLWDGPHLSPRTLPGMAERTFVIGSMSKSHAMTGSRIGWIVAPAEAASRCIDLATITHFSVPGYIQRAALFALTRGPAFEAEVAAPFRRRRALALKVLARHRAIKEIPSQGAMYLMLDIRSTGLSGQAFADALLDSRHIAVMPGESFGKSAAGHVRIALTVADGVLESALESLCDFAESHAHA